MIEDNERGRAASCPKAFWTRRVQNCPFFVAISCKHEAALFFVNNFSDDN
jgi:hypothetical protein